MWDELRAKCEQTKADCERETARMMALVETVKAKPKPDPASAPLATRVSPDIPSWMNLVWSINEFVQRSDRADEKAKQLRISAGIGLITLKQQFQEIPVDNRAPDERTWDAFCHKYLAFHRSRANQLIAFVEGRANEDEVRENDRARKRLEKEIKQKQELASPGIPGGEDDIEAEIDPDPDTRRLAFILRADQARLFAKYTGPIDDEVLGIAKEALAAWITLVHELTKEMMSWQKKELASGG